MVYEYETLLGFTFRNKLATTTTAGEGREIMKVIHSYDFFKEKAMKQKDGEFI